MDNNKEFIYFSRSEDYFENDVPRGQNELLKNNVKNYDDLLKHFFPDILKAIGNRAIKEETLSLRELEQHLQKHVQTLAEDNFKNNNLKTSNLDTNQIKNSTNSVISKKRSLFMDQNNDHNDKNGGTIAGKMMSPHLNINFNNASILNSDLPIVSQLIERGYVTDSKNWLNKKGFFKVGFVVLDEIIKSLKSDKLGMHETHFVGNGNIILEDSKKFELGDELSNININSTILNFVERRINLKQNIEFPLELDYEDFEIYETIEDIQVATAYCIDLSSTMKYTSMYNDLSRIEAAKRALWSLYILNKKFFPLDSVYVIGFGSVASKIDAYDIPFLKTFETNTDFLHYTNYQSAYRLAKKILKRNGAKNKRIVMITDGHPSACFIDSIDEREKLMKQRPYSHFYFPDRKKIYQQYTKNNEIKLDVKDNQTVYLCYRYRQIDQYIGEQTIKEAKITCKSGIDIDTIMISEDDTLLDFINDLAKSVNGKSIYIDPKYIDKILIKDYLLNKKKMIKK